MPEPARQPVPAEPMPCPECGYDVTGLRRCPECGFDAATLVLRSPRREWRIEPGHADEVLRTLRRLHRRSKWFIGVPVGILLLSFAMAAIAAGVQLALDTYGTAFEAGTEEAGPIRTAFEWTSIGLFIAAFVGWYLFGVVDRLRIRLFVLPSRLAGASVNVSPPTRRRFAFLVGVVTYLAIVAVAMVPEIPLDNGALFVGMLFAFETALALGTPCSGRSGARRAEVPGDLLFASLDVVLWAVAFGFGVEAWISQRDYRVSPFEFASMIAGLGWLSVTCSAPGKIQRAIRFCEAAQSHEKAAAPEGTAAEKSESN